MKYIDAEKLKAEIKDRLHCNGSFDECGDTAWDYDQGMVAAYNYVLSFIDSLQQEQKPADLVEEAYIENRNDGTHTCATTKDGFDAYMNGFNTGYEEGKIALICDLRDWIKEQTKK